MVSRRDTMMGHQTNNAVPFNQNLGGATSIFSFKTRNILYWQIPGEIHCIVNSRCKYLVELNTQDRQVQGSGLWGNQKKGRSLPAMSQSCSAMRGRRRCHEAEGSRSNSHGNLRKSVCIAWLDETAVKVLKAEYSQRDGKHFLSGANKQNRTMKSWSATV